MAQNQVDIEELSPLETLKYWMDFAPFHWWLKPEAYSVSEVGDIEVRLHFRPEFQRAPDAPEYHGGVVAALIDIVAHATVAVSTRRMAPTIDLRIDYHRVASRTLHAKGILKKLGRTIASVDVEVWSEEEKLLAIGRGVLSTGR